MSDIFSKPDGEPYRPSNGTEGGIFMDQWCANCANDPYPDNSDNPEENCELIIRSMTYEIEDDKYPEEWIWDDGNPTCTAFKTEKEREELTAEFLEWISDASNLTDETEYFFREANKRGERSASFYSLALKWEEEVKNDESR